MRKSQDMTDLGYLEGVCTKFCVEPSMMRYFTVEGETLTGAEISGITKVIRTHPLETTNASTKYQSGGQTNVAIPQEIHYATQNQSLVD